MTEIERLWDKARDDPIQREIHQALVSEVTVLCIHCGEKTILDKVAGCYTCTGCGHRVCGDS